MKKIIQIIGCRPHFIKFTQITDKDIIIHTGQHYSKDMSEYLISEFNLPKIKYNLNKTDLVDMQKAITRVLRKEKPSLVIVYGDTTSTLAGTMAAYGLGIEIAHIESGVRSRLYQQRRESEIRAIVDRHSDYLFCPTRQAEINLKEEGIEGITFFVGDPHYDEYIKHRQHQNLVLATFHRAEHTDSKSSLEKVFDLLKGYEYVIFPCHHRTWKAINRFKVRVPENIMMMPPVSYKEMQRYYQIAEKVITDSGGVTKEAYFAGCPVEPYEIDEWEEVFSFGDGHSKEKIRKEILNLL